MQQHGEASLNDPPKTTWDPLFQDEIDGIIKVAGPDHNQAEAKLIAIKKILGHSDGGDGPIQDILKASFPTTTVSRVDGHVRSKAEKLDGVEQ